MKKLIPQDIIHNKSLIMKGQKTSGPGDYRALLDRVAGIIDEARRTTTRQINTIITQTYWEIGRMIIQEESKRDNRSVYGEAIVGKLGIDLSRRFGKGFKAVNLWNMRQFYLTYPTLYAMRRKFGKNEKIYALRRELSWTHFRILMRIENNSSRNFYEIETVKNNWSTRELDRQINSLLYERLALSKNRNKVKQLAHRGQIIQKPEDVIKDPYVLEFLGLSEMHEYTETQLEQKLLDHLQEFVLELGKGFTFVARQKRITIDNEHYYIDLTFYHRVLRCPVLIDLKVGKLDHRDVGQMNFYLNYIRDKELLTGENPPIGIILCTESNRSRVFVEYALGGLSNKVFVSKYKLYLPTKKELETEVRREAKLLALTKN